MNSVQQYRIKSPHYQLFIYCFWAMIFVFLGIWCIYLLTIGATFDRSILFVFLMTLSSLPLALSTVTRVLSYKAGRLSVNSMFSRQSVELSRLIKSEKYLSIGRYPFWILRLEDSDGHSLRIIPRDYSSADFAIILETLKPYIFINRVDKNFMKLEFYNDSKLEMNSKDSNYPTSSAVSVTKNVFLRIYLPAILITLIIIVWAIATKQPAFH